MDTQMVREVAKASFDSAEAGQYGRGDTAVLHILMVYGEDAGDGNILGFAQDATVVILPPWNTLPRITPPVEKTSTMRDLVQRALLIHETGHVLGLVDNGVPMQNPHAHPDSPHHSANKQSVMYRAIDMFDAQMGFLLPDEAPPYTFDADDLADLRAFQAEANRPPR